MAETRVERVHTENVVLDIGGDIGALLIYTDEARRGDEIELSPKGKPSERVHNQVHERAFGGHSVFAAVYPALRAGDYDIWKDDTERAGDVTIVGGAVASVDWRSTKHGGEQHRHGSHSHSHEHGHSHDHEHSY